MRARLVKKNLMGRIILKNFPLKNKNNLKVKL